MLRWTWFYRIEYRVGADWSPPTLERDRCLADDLTKSGEQEEARNAVTEQTLRIQFCCHPVLPTPGEGQNK
jgi:hypothetical protein